MRIAVAASGGVDSLAALLMLNNEGHEVLALHGRFLDNDGGNVSCLADVCRRLGVPLHVADLRATFRREVIRPFVEGLRRGLTPNPCAACNARVKFGALLDTALDLGCQALATGHYASFGPDGPRIPANRAKDQSYFLGLVPRERLKLALFPLALTPGKEQTRAFVAAAGIRPPAGVESQDVCFFEDMGCQSFMAGQDLPAESGPVLLRDVAGCEREIGRHHGLWRYTVGQRKGLGIAWSEPLYVLEKRRGPAGGCLVVGCRDLLGMKRITTEPANFFAPFSSWPQGVLIRARHRGELMPAVVDVRDDGCLDIRLAAPAFPTACGQIAAVYGGAGCLLAAGVVRDVRQDNFL